MLWCFWIGYTRLRQPQKKKLLVFSACLTLDSAIKTPASCHTTNQWLLDIFNSFKAHPNPPNKQPKEKKTTTQKQSTLFNNIIPSSESSPPKKISPNPPKQPNMSLKMGCIIWPLNRENDPRDFKGGYRSPRSPSISPRPHCSLHHNPPSPTSKPGPPRSAPPAPCRCPWSPPRLCRASAAPWKRRHRSESRPRSPHYHPLRAGRWVFKGNIPQKKNSGWNSIRGFPKKNRKKDKMKSPFRCGSPFEQVLMRFGAANFVGNKEGTSTTTFQMAKGARHVANQKINVFGGHP